MRGLFRPFLGAFLALFLSSTVFVAPAFADEFDFGGGPPPPPTPTVNVTDNCTASAVDGTSHTYSQSGQFLGICAFVAAKAQGVISAYELLYDNNFGFYLQSLNGITPSATQYWALYLNNGYSNDGLSTMVIAQGDILKFQLTDFTDNSQIGSPVSFQIGTLTATPVAAPASSNSGSGGSLMLHAPFDTPLALAFLEKAQRADGSFGSPLLNDWVAIASAGGGAGDMRTRLSAYETANHPALLSVTDYERHAMALQALGINPYSGTSVDVIAPIVKAFDGTQVGDPSLVNDDIFALFPLMHAGYTASDDIIAKTTAFIISKQRADGSWDGSVDMTAAAVQALSLVRSIPGTSDATSNALGYLRREQESDGGFGNASATSWAMQAIAAAEQSGSDWNAGTYRTPDYYLATKQERDGGVLSESAGMEMRLWATAYAIPAVERKTWDSLLSSFPRPVMTTTETQAAEAASATTSTTAAATVTAATLAEFSDTLQELLNVIAENQKAPAEQAPKAQAPDAAIAISAEAAAIPIPPPAPSVSPQFAETAAVATVDYGVPLPWWKWITASLLAALIAGLARHLHKRYRSRRFGAVSKQKQE